MKALICPALGPAEQLHIADIEAPVPAAGQVRIRARYAAMNFPDQLMIRGRYQVQPALPFVPGFEVAGEVEQLGEGVSGLEPGERVMAMCLNHHGGYAELALADSRRVVKLPDSMDLATAAAFFSSFGTAAHALLQRAALQAGELLVVLGAGGGLGAAAVALGKALGARVVAVAGSAEKLQLAHQQGADEGINYRTENVAERLRDISAGRGVDVCVDGVGGDLFALMSRAMAWNGRLLVLGFASGVIPALAANLPLLKCYQLVGVYWDKFMELFAQHNQSNFEWMFGLYEQGALRPYSHTIYDLEDYLAAFQSLEQGQPLGRSVIAIQ